MTAGELLAYADKALDPKAEGYNRGRLHVIVPARPPGRYMPLAPGGPLGKVLGARRTDDGKWQSLVDFDAAKVRAFALRIAARPAQTEGS